MILVISGFFPRYTAIFQWWVSFSFFQSASIMDGGDQICSVISFYLIPIALLDSRKNHWVNDATNNRHTNFIAYMLFFFIQIQVAIIYLQAGIEKPYKVDEWLDGTAVYYWFNHNMFGGPIWIMSWLNPILSNAFFVSLLTWGTIIFELTLFGAFFMEKERKRKLFPYGITFHLGILIVHGLVSFSFAITGALILYLLPKNEEINIRIFRNDKSLRKTKV